MTHAPSSDQASQGVPLGRFRHDLGDHRWWWSDDLFGIYGFEPGAVDPSGELALSRVHPQDRERLSTALAEASGSERPFAVFHRLEVDGTVRHVLTCGHTTLDDGRRPQTTGYVLDLTEHRRLDSREAVEDAIARVTERRAEIEQAKGALMTQYGIDADQAFSVLSAYSQRSNLKVREVAKVIVEAASEDHLSGPVARQRLDSLLVAISQRDG